jgi:hypothetical protein
LDWLEALLKNVWSPFRYFDKGLFKLKWDFHWSVEMTEADLSVPFVTPWRHGAKAMHGYGCAIPLHVQIINIWQGMYYTRDNSFRRDATTFSKIQVYFALLLRIR